MKIRACALPAAVLLASYPVGLVGQEVSKPLSPIHYSSDALIQLNGLNQTTRVVLRSPAEWVAFWNAQGLPTYAEVPPEIDFTREMVLLAGADVAPDSLLGTQIESVWMERDTIVAAVKLYTGAGCRMPTVLFPVSAVRTPQMPHPVRFVDRLPKGGC